MRATGVSEAGRPAFTVIATTTLLAGTDRQGVASSYLLSQLGEVVPNTHVSRPISGRGGGAILFGSCPQNKPWHSLVGFHVRSHPLLQSVALALRECTPQSTHGRGAAGAAGAAGAPASRTQHKAGSALCLALLLTAVAYITDARAAHHHQPTPVSAPLPSFVGSTALARSPVHSIFNTVLIQEKTAEAKDKNCSCNSGCCCSPCCVRIGCKTSSSAG